MRKIFLLAVCAVLGISIAACYGRTNHDITRENRAVLLKDKIAAYNI